MDFYNSEEEKEPAYITAKARISPLVTLLNRSSPDGERKEIFNRLINLGKNVSKKLEIVFNKLKDEDEMEVIAFDIGRIQKLTKKIKDNPDDIVSFKQALEYIGIVNQAMEETYSEYLEQKIK